MVEGHVAVRAHGAPDSRGVELTAGELGTVAENGAILESRVADISIFSSWTGGRLVFDNAPVREVLTEIGRWYDADIRMADTTLANQGLTITLEGEALSDVLRTLAIALEVDYRRDGRTVELIPRR